MHQFLAFLAFLLGMLSLIAIHEFGHYLAAKLTGMAVPTFSIGFGPTLYSRVVGQTEWKIGALPFGGYVAIMGHGYTKEMADEVLADLKKDTRRSPESLEFNWHSSKGGLQQLLVAVGGPLANLVLASLLALVIFATHGISTISSPITVSAVAPGSSVAEVLHPGDVIERVCGLPTTTFDDLLLAISTKQCEQTISIEVQRDGKSAIANISTENVATGGLGFDVARSRTHPSFLGLVGESIKTPIEQAVLQLRGIKALLTGQASAGNLGGPIMIFSIGTAAASKGFWSLLSTLQSLSGLLAVMNLLPLPGLDGFASIEAGLKMVRGSEIPEGQRALWSTLKVMVILGLFGVAFWADIQRFVVPFFGG
jgi:regulator of sigma E protease